ncbi:site-specific integrase [Cesiribacter sp. SM1]|uniref:tyrosine-type recombinase/integrase n=1 Tax=Cesiribacter sp. SM1 TaxID=2861196 RepID=UPI001CD7BA92|nr:site-specific integrase [Cesiribacter sp. SM1]
MLINLHFNLLLVPGIAQNGLDSMLSWRILGKFWAKSIPDLSMSVNTPPTLASLLDAFKQSLNKENNYVRVARQYCFYLLDHQPDRPQNKARLISRHTAEQYLLDKKQPLITIVNRFVRFCEEAGISYFYADREATPLPHSLLKLIHQFVHHNERLAPYGFSRLTYYNGLKMYFQWAYRTYTPQNPGDLFPISMEAMDAFREHLLFAHPAGKQKRYSTDTVKNYVTVLRSFVHWQVEHWSDLSELLQPALASPGEAVPSVSNPPRPKELMTATFTAAERDYFLSFTNPGKDRLIAALMAYCGLSLNDVLGLVWANVLMEEDVLMLPQRVRGKTLVKVKLLGPTKQLLASYYSSLPSTRPSQRLFESYNRFRLQQKFTDYLNRAGLKQPDTNLQSLRLTAGRLLLKAGVPEEEVMAQMRYQRKESIRSLM